MEKNLVFFFSIFHMNLRQNNLNMDQFFQQKIPTKLHH